jgi:protein-tyrosine-phosphatase/DNA-binding transcriptional ArsR family regulator
MELTDAASAFAALSQESRLKVLRALVTAGPNGLSAGDLADQVVIPASTLSFHLAALERSGMTRSTRQGRQIIHAVRFAGLRELLSFLTETCCGSRPELCGDLSRLLPQLPDEDVPMTAAFNVLFLCTRNSARSIMAEAILNKVGGGRFHAYSAGSAPGAKPVPEVLDKLRSLGHDVTGLRPKSWNEFTTPNSPRMDFVIALCDTLDGQVCPDVGETAVTGAWPLPDPVKFTGDAAQRSLMLNELYASLRRRIEIFTSLPFAKLDRMAVKARLDEIATSGLPTAASQARVG